ncbi:hypothetical protein PINS_up022408 [Pythium insidiosum]|nr:hypothetical protein PINS_up005935 [Pythium insidiosum]GLE10307.1 hypothetical protein PINS_up022408 [Pythium insidiosum]
MPVTRRAMAVANKVQDARDSDSDDEAPEVVSKESAKELALEQRRQEKDAARQQAISAKRKRKAADEEEAPKADADAAADEETQQGDDDNENEEEDDEAPALPDDVLSALATRDEEDKAEQELESALDRQRRKRAASMKQRTHIRDFGSVQVRTIDTLDAAQRRELTAAAASFLDRKSAPHRARMNVLEGHASQFTKKQKTRMAGARS